MTVWGVPLYLAILITIVISFLLGALVFRIAIRPVLHAPEETIVVSCIGLFIGFEALCLWIWGSDSAEFPHLFSDRIWSRRYSHQCEQCRYSSHTGCAHRPVGGGLQIDAVRIGDACRRDGAEQ